MEIIARKRKPLERVGYTEEDFTLDYYVAFLYANNADIRFGEATLYDISQKRVSTTAAIHFFLKSWNFLLQPYVSGSHAFDFDEFFAQSGTLSQKYPNRARKDVVNAALTAQALLDIDKTSADLFHRLLPEAQQTGERAWHLVDAVRSIEEKAFTILFKKVSHTEQEQIVRCIEPYLLDDTSAIRTLRVLGILQDASHLKEAFRAASRRSHTGPDTHVYRQIQNAIKIYLENAPEDESLPVSASDIQSVISDVAPIPAEITDVSWNQLKTDAAKLHQRSPRQLSYIVNPDSAKIAWGALTPPKKVTVSRDPSQQSKWMITYQWVDQESEEAMSVSLVIDTKKEQVDWTILESPDDPAATPVKRAFLHTLPSIFNECHDRISVRTTTKNPALAPSTPSVKRARVTDEIYTLRKEVKRHGKQQSKNLPETEDVALALTKFISNKITPPDTVDDPRLDSLNIQSSKQIILAIKNYNDKGGGTFKKLTHTPADGISRYTLRVNTDDGKVRVICIKSGTHETGDLFTIDKIYKRRDAYKRLYRQK